jgi:hypothetical protein
MGQSGIALARLKARYWFDADAGMPVAATCNAAWLIGCPVVTQQFGTVSPARPGASHYLEIGFTSAAPTLAPGATTQEIQTSFHYATWGTVNRMNDYSWNANPTAPPAVDSPRVTLYQNVGTSSVPDWVPVWGVEPPPP